MLTRSQIQRLSHDARLLEAFSTLVNAKLRQWRASHEFEVRAGKAFDSLECHLSSFSAMADDPYNAVEEDLCEFLQDLVSEEQLQNFEVREFEVISGGKPSRPGGRRVQKRDLEDG